MQEFTVDATNQSLGRLASKVASMLRGKHLPSFEPSVEPKIIITISNLKKVKFTGQKFAQKDFKHYSGYHSGLKTRKLSDLWAKDANEVLRMSVYRMLPKNKTRDKIMNNLRFSD